VRAADATEAEMLAIAFAESQRGKRSVKTPGQAGAERWRRQEARGDVIVVRYADDLVAGSARFRSAGFQCQGRSSAICRAG
jgi:hypothetical protein